MASTIQQWADLPPDLLGQVIARLPFPDDRARLRAVCRPWHSAVREHVCPELPWIIHSDGTFVTLPDYRFHRRVPFPDNTKFIGATNGWLALYYTDAINGRRSYLLHNPFTRTTMQLPGLDSLIGMVSDKFEIRKMLMRSQQDDLVAVTTNSCNYPIILCRHGKSGVWFPGPKEMPYASIFDIAFHKRNLYGITVHNELVALGLEEDDDGIPIVKTLDYVIKHMTKEEDEEYEEYDDDDNDDDGYVDVSINQEDEEVRYNQTSDNDKEEEMEHNETSSLDEEDEHLECNETSLLEDMIVDVNAILKKLEDEGNDFGFDGHEEVSIIDDDEYAAEDKEYNDMSFEGALTMPDGIEEDDSGCDEDLPCKSRDYTETSRHLIASNDKLFMIRRQRCIPCTSAGYNLNVEALEANIDAGVWVSSTAGVTNTFFVSERHSKSVPASRDADDGLNSPNCYFVEEHDIVHFESQSLAEIVDRKSTWFFPQCITV